MQAVAWRQPSLLLNMQKDRPSLFGGGESLGRFYGASHGNDRRHQVRPVQNMQICSTLQWTIFKQSLGGDSM